MKPERRNGDGCIQIGYLSAPGGQIVSKEYLLRRGRYFFTIEVVGVPLPEDFQSLQESEILPLPIPRPMFDNPDATCNFLLATPLVLLSLHLVPEILPEEIKKDIP